MNLDRIRQVLKKVNALVENLDEQGQTSTIEKDLLKRYLMEIYETVTETAASEPVAPKEPVPIAPPVMETPPVEKTPPVMEQPADPVPPKMNVRVDDQTTYYDAERVTPEAVEVPATDASPLQDAVINEFTDPVQYFPPESENASEENNSPEPVAPASVEPEVPKVPEPEPEPVMAESQQETTAALGNIDRFDAIFTQQNATDLADKFQLQKITTIEAAMGINQRMLTINELFDGDHKAFTDTVTALNETSSFEQAKSLIVNGAADRFNWDKEAKQGLAKDFVKLVHRKFS